MPPPVFWFVIAGIFAVNALIALALSARGMAAFLLLCASTALLAAWAGFSALRRRSADGSAVNH